MTKWILIVTTVLLIGFAYLVFRTSQGEAHLMQRTQSAAPNTIAASNSDDPASATITSPQAAMQGSTLENEYNIIVNELVGNARIKALMSLGLQVVESGSIDDLLWLARNIESGSAKEFLFTRIPARLLAHDTEAALEWLMALPREGETVYAFAAFGKAYAHIDPDAAFDFVTTLTWKEAQSNFIKNLIDHLARNGVDKALTWIDSAAATDVNSAELLKGSAIALARYAKTNDEFSQILQRLGWKESAHQDSALSRMFSQWAGNDPRAAATAAMQAAPGSIQRKWAFDEVMEKWYNSDSVGLSSWINEI